MDVDMKHRYIVHKETHHQDYLYRKEFEDIQTQIQTDAIPIDFKLITAFSRQGPKKVYVQHRLQEHQDAVWEMLEHKKGYFYVCGYVFSFLNSLIPIVMPSIWRMM